MAFEIVAEAHTVAANLIDLPLRHHELYAWIKSDKENSFDFLIKPHSEAEN